MGMVFYVGRGSGRGTCKMCDKPIAENDIQVEAHAYRDSGRAHLTCINKKANEV